ncbi:MAG: hypothetical protein MI757_01775, partial [Pirellulales bacterium]|nr:hypothetical protein [Pirellulales bacterium]
LLIVATSLAQVSGDTPDRESLKPADPPTVVTRQMDFQLPFKIPQVEPNRSAPVEVRLFVSPDEGRTWQTHSRVSPTKGFCRFATKHDGQYWFMIRTVDRGGRLWPQDAAKAEMKVIVDTQPPRVDLQATWKPAGEITATWTVQDATLEPGTAKLQYRAASTDPWQKVAIPPVDATRPQEQVGRATWWPRTTTAQITVRFEARDKAGNPAVVQRTLKSPATVVGGDKIAEQQVARPPVANNFAEGTPAQSPQQPPQQQTRAPRTQSANQPPAQPEDRQLAATARARRTAATCQVKLTSTARHQDRVTIRWQTSGTSILRKTIHIAYSKTAEGPWLPVAMNQQDDGHHVWQLRHDVPQQVFLMIEVVDRAGASSRYVTPQPLWLRAKPNAIPQAGRQPAEYRFF